MHRVAFLNKLRNLRGNRLPVIVTVDGVAFRVSLSTYSYLPPWLGLTLALSRPSSRRCAHMTNRPGSRGAATLGLRTCVGHIDRLSSIHPLQRWLGVLRAWEIVAKSKMLARWERESIGAAPGFLKRERTADRDRRALGAPGLVPCATLAGRVGFTSPDVS
jgi:hypothetical protein